MAEIRDVPDFPRYQIGRLLLTGAEKEMSISP
jgi:hypothetical protein